MTPPGKSTPDAEARARLREAMAAHQRGQIEEAIAAAQEALRLAPDFADAHQYLGTTLVTRKRDFVRGLRELERARDLAPDDPAAHYTLGWSYEFVAHELSRRLRQGRRPAASLDPDALYEKAAESLRRCIALRPDEGMLDDAEKLLETITG